MDIADSSINTFSVPYYDIKSRMGVVPLQKLYNDERGPALHMMLHNPRV
jgi:hypothetical protein